MFCPGVHDGLCWPAGRSWKINLKDSGDERWFLCFLQNSDDKICWRGWMSGASVCLSAPWLFHSLCHSSCFGCSKPWLNVGYFGGFLHKSDVGDKWVSWGLTGLIRVVLWIGFPVSDSVVKRHFLVNCVWTLCFTWCMFCVPPLLAVHAVYLFILNMQISALSIAATSFHSFVSPHQGLYLKGILRPSQAVIV